MKDNAIKQELDNICAPYGAKQKMLGNIMRAYDKNTYKKTGKSRVLKVVLPLAAGLAAVVIVAAVTIPLLTGGGELPKHVAAADTTPVKDGQTDPALPTHDVEHDSDMGEAGVPGGMGVSLPADIDITESIDFSGKWRLASVIESGKTNMVCIVSESGEGDIDESDDFYCGIEHLAPYQNSSRHIIIERSDPSHPTAYEVYEIIPDSVISTAGQNPRIIDTEEDDVHYIELDGITVGLYANGFMLIYKQTLPNGNVQFYATDVTGCDVTYSMPYDEGHYDQPYQRIIEYERADAEKAYVCMAETTMDEEVPNTGDVIRSRMVDEFVKNGKDGEYLWVGFRLYSDFQLVDEPDFVYNGRTISEWADDVNVRWDYYAHFGDFKEDDTEAYLAAFNKGEDAIEQAYREYWMTLQSDQDVIGETLHCVDSLKAAREAYDRYRQDSFSEIAFSECMRLREAGYDVSYQPPTDPYGFKGEMKGALSAQQIRDFPAGDYGYTLYAYGMDGALDA